MTAQALTRPLPTAREVVAHLVGVQAQSPWVAPYVIRPRLAAGAELAPLDVVRTWVMRGTLHMVTSEDAGWLVALLGPVFAAKTRPRRLQLGLTDELLARATAAVARALPATRDELLAVAASVGVPKGQARAHLLSHLCMSGRACLDGTESELFVPLPTGVSPAEPLTELASRFLHAHGPANAEDFASWSGLPLGKARAVIPERAPEPVTDPVPRVRLLGHLDPYLLAYRDRAFALDPARSGAVQRGGGFLQPVVVVDGRVAGTWSRTPKARRLEVTVDAFDAVPGDALAAELDALGTAFDLPVSLVRPPAATSARDDQGHGRA